MRGTCVLRSGRGLEQAAMRRAATSCAHHLRPAAWRRLLCHSASAASTSAPQQPPQLTVDRATHNQLQREEFSAPNVVTAFTTPLPANIQQRLKAIADSIPGLSASSRVVDVGGGTGSMVPHLQARGVKDILVVDLAEPMLEVLRRELGADATNVGNDLGLRTWVGDVVDLPNYLGWAADAFVFNSVLGNLHSPRAGLLKAALQLRPGGHVVVSHPLGRAWHTQLAAAQPRVTPHLLPGSRAELEALVQGLPLQVVEFRDEPELYLAVLQVPPRYALPGAPVHMAAPVVTGFGRGSWQLGTPTANMDPVPLQATLQRLHQGVYYGWAQLVPRAEEKGQWSAASLQVHKMVMNVGRRPTVNTGDEAPTVEAHVLHEFERDFYGQELRVQVLGYIRPEMRFTGGLPELLNRIKLDIAIARNQLQELQPPPSL